MGIREFIKENREDLTAHVNQALGNDKAEFQTIDELRLWVLNDEGLYNWARSEGCKI